MINQTETIFDIPPATIPGNIQNENGELADAFGYFEASATDTGRAFTMLADFSLYIPNPCPPPGDHLKITIDAMDVCFLKTAHWSGLLIFSEQGSVNN